MAVPVKGLNLYRTANLSKEERWRLGHMYSNRQFDVSLDGKILSHTTTRNAFVLTPATRICRVPERKY